MKVIIIIVYKMQLIRKNSPNFSDKMLVITSPEFYAFEDRMVSTTVKKPATCSVAFIA